MENKKKHCFSYSPFLNDARNNNVSLGRVILAGPNSSGDTPFSSPHFLISLAAILAGDNIDSQLKGNIFEKEVKKLCF